MTFPKLKNAPCARNFNKKPIMSKPMQNYIIVDQLSYTFRFKDIIRIDDLVMIDYLEVKDDRIIEMRFHIVDEPKAVA